MIKKLDLQQKELSVKVNSLLFVSDSNPDLLCVATAEDLGIARSALNSVMLKNQKFCVEWKHFFKDKGNDCREI
jgi:hypothetical protein